MNRSHRTIRFRLTLWYSAALLGGQLISGLLIWFLFSHSLHADLDGSLIKRVRGLERYLALEAAENPNTLPKEMEEFAHTLPPDFLMRVQSTDGHLLATSGISESELSARLPALSSEGILRNVTLRDTPYRWFGERVPAGLSAYTVSLAAPLQPVEETLHHLAFLLLAVLPGVVLIAAIGGFWISRRALAPVVEMTTAAGSINFENLSARLNVPRTFDELQHLAETWNAMLQRIENSAIRITRFTADASHELRTPLSLICATTELALRRPRTPEAYKDALHLIQLEGERMTRLVEDLLFLARTDDDPHLSHQRPFDLRVPMQAAISDLLPKASTNNVSIETVELDSAAPIVGDEEAIRRLILVLLDNAVKYSPPGKHVTVALALSHHAAVLTIHDQGTGIPLESQPHVFERFYRADPSRQSAATPSYGLGLAIAHVIALQHGIHIDFESEPGSTTFSLHFALTQVPPPAFEAPSANFQNPRVASAVE